MLNRHCCILVLAVWAIGAAPSQNAAAGDCASDLATADELISGIRDREHSRWATSTPPSKPIAS